jgi:hypothetical protein
MRVQEARVRSHSRHLRLELRSGLRAANNPDFRRGEVIGSFSSRRLCWGPAAISKRINTSTARIGGANSDSPASARLMESSEALNTGCPVL